MWERVRARAAAPKTVTPTGPSTAYKLATIDGQSVSSSVEQRYQPELAKAAANCDGYSETQVGDLVVRGTQLIDQQGGVSTRTYELLQSINRTFGETDDLLAGSDRTEIVSLIIAIMLDG